MKKYKVCIDPGHGSKLKDPGAVSGALTRINESDTVLDIGLKLKEYLEQMDFEVIMTRQTKWGVLKAYNNLVDDLPSRVALANTSKADIYVSLHLNSCGSRQPNGIEIFKTSPAGEEIAVPVMEEILIALKEAGIEYNSRGIKNEKYYVLRQTDMPAILIEFGFMSNPRDLKIIQENKDLFAKSTANGIKRYFDSLEA